MSVRAGNTILAIVAVGCLMMITSSASAMLMTDLRLAGGGTTYEITSGTAVVELQFWARIENTSGAKLAKVYAAFRSSGGLINGDLSDAWGPDAGAAGAGFRTGTATLGTVVDLPSPLGSTNLDGNKDIGGLSDSSSTGWYSARSTTMVTGADFNLATVTFTGASWGTNTHGITLLEAIPQKKALTSSWYEGGATHGTTDYPVQGQTITLYKKAVAVVKDALGNVLDGTHGLTLDQLNPSGTLSGKDSTGSINSWKWDFNNDGTTDLTGTGDVGALALATLTYDPNSKKLTWAGGELSLEQGVYMSKLTVEYKTSPAITTGSQQIPLTLLPEPATMALLGLGGLLIAARRRRVA
jgi:hypothetical protein